jgi:hypothetical protein
MSGDDQAWGATLTPAERRSIRSMTGDLSQDGRFGAFSRLDSDEVSIALVDFEARTFVNYAVISEFNDIKDVVISRDGSLLACVVGVFGAQKDTEIWVIDRTGTVRWQLTGAVRLKAKPCFSQDGDKLLFFADMRHQYLPPQERLSWVGSSSGAMAVHELDLATGAVRLIDLPILPFPKACFYTNRNTVVAAYGVDVDNPEFDRLPVGCVCGNPRGGGYVGNFWQRIRPRFELTVGEADLVDAGTSRFKKFEMTMPDFASILDTFQMMQSPSEDGFLALLTLYDPRQDPGPELFSYRNYRPPEGPTIGLSWLSWDGGRVDVPMPGNFPDLSIACGSYDRSRVLAWLGNGDVYAPVVGRPFTHSAVTGWHMVDLGGQYEQSVALPVVINQRSVRIEIPELIDRNGIGQTDEDRFYSTIQGN